MNTMILPTQYIIVIIVSVGVVSFHI